MYNINLFYWFLFVKGYLNSSLIPFFIIYLYYNLSQNGNTQEQKLQRSNMARPNALPITFPSVLWPIRLADAFVSNDFLKNENINNDNLRYYFWEVLVKTTNEKVKQ